MPAPLVILQVTDLHLFPDSGVLMGGVDTENSLQRVLKQAHQKHTDIDTILVSGDLVQQATESSYQRVYNILKQYSTPTTCLPGNHDDVDLMQQIINSEQINCKKQLIFNYWQLICLNSQKKGSEGGYLSSSELDFLQNALSKNLHLKTIIALHHHPINSGSEWLDTMTIENSPALFSLLKPYPQVKLISCGHIHQELNHTKNDILVLGTPSTCFQFKPKSIDYKLDTMPPAYRIIKLFADGSIETKVHYLSNVQ